MEWLSFCELSTLDCRGVGMIEVPVKKIEGLKGGEQIFLFKKLDDGFSVPYAVLTFTHRAASGREGSILIGGPLIGYEAIPTEIKPDVLRKFDLSQLTQEWNLAKTQAGFRAIEGQFRIGPGELTDDTHDTREVSRELTSLRAIRNRDRWKGRRRRRG